MWGYAHRRPGPNARPGRPPRPPARPPRPHGRPARPAAPPPARGYGPSTITCEASDATVTWIVTAPRSHAITFSACSRSSMAWNASACARLAYRRAIWNE